MRFSAWVLTFKIKTPARCALRCSALPPVGCPADPHRSWHVLRRRPATETSRRPSRPPFALALTGRNWARTCDVSQKLRRSSLEDASKLRSDSGPEARFLPIFRVGLGRGRSSSLDSFLSSLLPPSDEVFRNQRAKLVVPSPLCKLVICTCVCWCWKLS